MITLPYEANKSQELLERAPAPSCLVKMYPLDIYCNIINLTEGQFVIGRDESCDLCLYDDSVSRRHARIERLQTAHIVTDLASTNGTFVNGHRIVRQQIHAGDRLRFGNQILKFLTQDHIETQYHETVYAMMTRDGLTGAYNKRYFLDALQRDIDRCKRHQRPMALMLLDIDHFKHVNDQYGHLAGDEVLLELSHRLHGIVRNDEVFARFGGEEFALLMSEATLQDGVSAAERCRSVISETPIAVSGEKIAITISVGVAEFDGCESISTNELLERADKCLYAAKESGRDQVQSYDGLLVGVWPISNIEFPM